MEHENQTILSLRAALEVSPGNVPLRQHLAEMLLQFGRAEEAEKEYRGALGKAPENGALKIGLAKAFYQQEKDSHAMVIVEQLVSQSDTPAQAYLLHARLLVRSGDVEFAVREYKNAVREDPGVKDGDLEDMLGIDADEAEAELVDGRLRTAWNGDSESRAGVEVERPSIDFSQVGGMAELKEVIRMKIIYPLQHAEMFKAYGKTVGGGILMYGPPGCGKTYLARATAGEIRAGFLAVGINDVLDMWIGGSERNLHELFNHARRNQPCVLFFDEVDALGASRSDMKGSAGRHLINQFLAETDGATSSNEGVLILAATNAPWHMDSAFRRPGRFDRVLFVPPPDEPARAAILRILCRGKPCSDIDHGHVAKKTRDFSGADLKSILDLAVEAKLTEAMKKGIPKPLTTRDLLAAAKQVQPSTREWFATARNYALYSNQSGAYNDVLRYLNIQ
jgi:SpoVK/Ycf46/Vps4 family AAA+-type ATPase